jgi:hypothetical protein
MSPRSLSSTAAAALYAPETGEVFLMLLTIAHAALTPSLRFANNTVDVMSRGDTYLGWPFQMMLPSELDDQLPTVTLQIDNVDRRIMEGVRALTSPPSVMLEVVLASSPDTVEAGPFAFTLRGCDYDALVVSGSLSFEDVLNEPYPAQTFTPGRFPGLFP